MIRITYETTRQNKDKTKTTAKTTTKTKTTTAITTTTTTKGKTRAKHNLFPPEFDIFCTRAFFLFQFYLCRVRVGLE